MLAVRWQESTHDCFKRGAHIVTTTTLKHLFMKKIGTIRETPPIFVKKKLTLMQSEPPSIFFRLFILCFSCTPLNLKKVKPEVFSKAQDTLFRQLKQLSHGTRIKLSTCGSKKLEIYLTKSVESSFFNSLSVFSISAETSALKKITSWVNNCHCLEKRK